MIVIKKYSNRRLYNTDSSSYITQDDIVDLIKKKNSFQITDVDSKKDITSSILMQIILEKQTTGTNLVPEEFLKQIILFNENNQSADMFSFLSNVLNFANSNNTTAIKAPTRANRNRTSRLGIIRYIIKKPNPSRKTGSALRTHKEA